MDLIPKAEKWLQENHALVYGDRIIIAVSGGPDSTALLHILYYLRHRLGISIHIAHVNHQLRPSASRDERFVAGLGRKLGVPVSTGRVRVKTSSGKSSIEEAAREKRFEFLLKLAKQKKANIIALGHTQDDLAETVLMRILRGTGLLGLQGILPEKTRNGIRLIRPLLSFSKKDILQYLKKNKIKYCIDPSNKNPVYFRNKIRRDLLPLLEKKYQTNIREVLSNLANTTAVDYDYLQKEGMRQLKKHALWSKNKRQVALHLSNLGQLHQSQQRMVIRLAVQVLQGNLNQFSVRHMKEIEDLIGQRPNRSRVDLPHGITVQKNKGFLTITAIKT